MIQKKIKPTKINDAYVFLVPFFILSFSYFYWVADSLLYFQEKQSLFIFSSGYLKEHLLKPGGLLEYAGKFVTQFYTNSAVGSVSISIILILIASAFLKINKLLFSGNNSSILISLIPTSLVLMLQTHYYHNMVYNLGFLMVLIFFIITILSRNKYYRYISIALLPIFYYLIGAFVGIFIGMYLVFSLFHDKGIYRYIFSTYLLGIAAISFYAFKSVLFLQPFQLLYQYPLPNIDDSIHRLILFILIGFILFYPLLSKIIFQIHVKKINKRRISLIGSCIVFLLTIFFLYTSYNPQNTRILQLEKMIYEEEWAEAIELHENYPSKNLIGQYFYNIALSETDQLCDRLFFGRQDFGSNSLILPWQKEHLNWGSYFFYSTGLINEAHRWAYEEMVVYGYRPQNIKMLAKTNLINGNLQRAKKYINILKKTVYYQRWANEYENLAYESAKIKMHPKLGEKIEIMPKDNFFIEITNPQNNIPLLLNSNQNNKRAFEYQIAWLLLTKDVESLVNNIYRMKDLGYTRIPRHIEEAVLAYYNSTGEIPNLGGLAINQETKTRFDQYVTAFKINQTNSIKGKENMRTKFGNTFWFYFHF